MEIGGEGDDQCDLSSPVLRKKSKKVAMNQNVLFIIHLLRTEVTQGLVIMANIV